MIRRAKKEIAKVLTGVLGRPEEEIFSSLETPKIYDHGHLAYPLFVLAKERRMAPPQLAKELAAEVQGKSPLVAKVEAAGGFLNFTLTPAALQDFLFSALRDPSRTIGHNRDLEGKNVVVDFSSPNVAKQRNSLPA